jgi:2'-5' RNA ligase
LSPSGLVIPIPEADARFADLRRRFDAQAALGVPAHITILFPFMPPEQIDEDVHRRLKRLFKRFSPFRCVLSRVERFPQTAYLAPVHPEPFIELTQAVAREFPSYPPYGGAHAGVVPHLTIADGNEQAACDAEALLRADLQAHGPLASQCASVRLLGNASGRWETLGEFALIGHQG